MAMPRVSSYGRLFGHKWSRCGGLMHIVEGSTGPPPSQSGTPGWRAASGCGHLQTGSSIVDVFWMEVILCILNYPWHSDDVMDLCVAVDSVWISVRPAGVDHCGCDIFDFAAAKALNNKGLNHLFQECTTIAALNNRLVSFIELVRTNITNL